MDSNGAGATGGRAASPTASTSSRQSSTRTAGPASTSNLESTITRLLVATKQLLEGLAKWSRGEVNEEAISAIYVKLGNDFNVACAAFARENISMNELLSVPSDLRICLETCLSDTPSQATLERHLPQVRQIIIGLLHGLREKQRLYRDGVAARRQREKERAAAGAAGGAPNGAAGGAGGGGGGSGGQASGVPLTPHSAGRSREELRRFVSHAQTVGPPSSGLDETAPRPRYSDSSVSSNRRSTSEASSLANGTGSGGGGDARLSAALSSRSSAPIRGGSLREQRDSARSSRATLEEVGFMGPPPPPPSAAAGGAPPIPRSNSATSLDSSASGRASRRPLSPPPPARNRDEPPVPRTPTMDAFPSSTPPSSFPLPATSATPVMVVRPPSTVSLHPPSSLADDVPLAPPPSLPIPPPPPAQAQAQSASLEALKHQDHLSRRASKRYSAYAIQKMTSPSPGGGGGGGTSPNAGGGEGSPRSERERERERAHGRSRAEFLASPSSGGGGADVRRSKSERDPSHSHSHGSSGGGGVTRSRSTAGGLGRGAPPVPGIPRSWSSQQSLRLGAVGAGQGSPILEAEEGEDENDEGESARSPPAFPPPPAPGAALGAPAYPSHLTRRAPSPALPPIPSDTDSRPASTTPPSPSGPLSRAPSVPFSPPTASPAVDAEPDFPCAIYLRLGPRVRKAILASPPTDIQDLRQLFVERFGFTPGVEGWPEVWIEERGGGGVRYELEELEEVRRGAVVCLNVDAVEQVKHHIDAGLSTLAQDIKELRATVTAMRRLSHAGRADGPSPTLNALLSPDATSPGGGGGGMRPSPSQRQFEQAAERVLRMQRAGSAAGSAAAEEGGEGPKGEGEKEEEKQQPAQAPARSSTDPFSPTTTTSIGPIVTTLQSQHAEVQALRREIGILRQVYSDFSTQTRSMFASVRVQTSHLQGLAQSKLSTDRAFVEAGTAKLDGESTDLVVRVDELQDTIEQLRADTVKGVKPRPQQLSETAAALRRALEQRQKLVDWLKDVKPTWSQMWSVELGKILGEQKAVETQETLLGELSEDLDDAEQVLRNIQAVAKQLKPASSGGASRAVSNLGGATDAQEGLSTVLLEVKALNPDPTKRLEAIERAERERERQNANRTDEFKEELGDFVGKGKLKKSGGIEETERLRQMRSEATLRQMFSS
ncbi:hypothetical protein JCM10207_006992 [Rhodosporidiobolus poonsookiae]